MKLLSCLLLSLLLTGCVTSETFDANGKRTSRTSSPSPETWTVIGNAVSSFGSAAVASWASQIADQQRWEKGLK